jgi:hypothetical protein
MSGVVLVKPIMRNGEEGEWSPSIVAGAPGSSTIATESTIQQVRDAVNTIAEYQALGYNQELAIELLESLETKINSVTKEETLQLVLNMLNSISLSVEDIPSIYNAVNMTNLLLDNNITAINNLSDIINDKKNISSWVGVYNNVEGVFTAIYNSDGTINRFSFTDKNNVTTDPINLADVSDPDFSYEQHTGLAYDTVANVSLSAPARKVIVENYGNGWICFELVIESVARRYYLGPLKKLVYEDNSGRMSTVTAINNVFSTNEPYGGIAPGTITNIIPIPVVAVNVLNPIIIEAWMN